MLFLTSKPTVSKHWRQSFILLSINRHIWSKVRQLNITPSTWLWLNKNNSYPSETHGTLQLNNLHYDILWQTNTAYLVPVSFIWMATIQHRISNASCWRCSLLLQLLVVTLSCPHAAAISWQWKFSDVSIANLWTLDTEQSEQTSNHLQTLNILHLSITYNVHST